MACARFSRVFGNLGGTFQPHVSCHPKRLKLGGIETRWQRQFLTQQSSRSTVRHAPSTRQHSLAKARYISSNYHEAGTYYTASQLGLLKPILFVAGVSALAYTGAAFLTSRTDERYTRRLRQLNSGFFSFSSSLQELQKGIETDEVNRTLTWLRRVQVPEPIVNIYVSLENYWLKRRDSERAAIALICVNAMVFLAWQFPHPMVQTFMSRHFTHSTLSGKNYTLLTSVFSHQSIAHLAFNMLALYSFGPLAFEYLSHSTRAVSPTLDTNTNTLTNTTTFYHSIAFFAAAGMLASLVPHAINIVHKLPQLPMHLRLPPGPQLEAAMLDAHKSQTRLPTLLLPSLGASGAIYGLLTICATEYPQANVSLIFLPFVPISIRTGVVGLVAVDMFGLIRGWQVFGHAGHLSGAAIGVAAWWGEGGIWTRFRQLVDNNRTAAQK